MAFPSVVTRSTGTANAASITVTLPSGSADGDLIFILLRGATEGGNRWSQTSGTTGWVEITGSDSNGQVSLFKQIGASESNPSFDNVSSERLLSIALRITGAEDPSTQFPERSTVSTGTSTGPNPSGVTPTGGAKDYLWLAVASTGDGRASFDSAPADFTDLQNVGTPGAANGCSAGTAERLLNASTLNPGAFTISRSELWSAHTIAVHPVAAAAGAVGRGLTNSVLLGGKVRRLVG